MYVAIGEFAKLCQVSKHTLFHYHDIGLFEPAFVDDNGYRFYHALQFDTFSTIHQLRVSGMSLAAIKSYMDQRSPEHLLTLCAAHEASIDAQIRLLKKVKNSLQVVREQVNEAMASHLEVFVEAQPERHLLVSEPVTQIDDHFMTKAFARLVKESESSLFRGVSGMIHPVQRGGYDVDEKALYFYLESTCRKKRCDCWKKTQGSYLTTYHYGGYDTLESSYKRLMAHAEKENMRLGTCLYEESLLGDWAVFQQEDYVLKLSVQILYGEAL